MGQRWLLNIESTLRQFVREGPSVKSLAAISRVNADQAARIDT